MPEEIDQKYVDLVSANEIALERLQRANSNFKAVSEELDLLKLIIKRVKQNNNKQRIFKKELPLLINILERYREAWIFVNRDLQEAEYKANYANEELATYEAFHPQLEK